jgi:hypothetical protein
LSTIIRRLVLDLVRRLQRHNLPPQDITRESSKSSAIWAMSTKQLHQWQYPLAAVAYQASVDLPALIEDLKVVPGR